MPSSTDLDAFYQHCCENAAAGGGGSTGSAPVVSDAWVQQLVAALYATRGSLLADRWLQDIWDNDMKWADVVAPSQDAALLQLALNAMEAYHPSDDELGDQSVRYHACEELKEELRARGQHMRITTLAQQSVAEQAEQAAPPPPSPEATSILSATDLKTQLRDRIVGHHGAVEAVAQAVIDSIGSADRAGVDTPIAAFMFLGPTGVGKTTLAKALAASLFGSEEALVRLRMSDLTTNDAVPWLVGAPPGCAEGYLLADPVGRRPCSVVMLEELEKAPKSMLDVIVQILASGRLTDAQGRVASFKNTILIMTSTLGSEELSPGVMHHEGAAAAAAGGTRGAGAAGGSVGAPAAEAAALAATASAEEAASVSPGRGARPWAAGQQLPARTLARQRLFARVRPHFPRKFLNFARNFMVFEPLGPEDIKRIVMLKAKHLASEKGGRLELDESAAAHLAQAGFDPMQGARPLDAALQRHLQPLLDGALATGEPRGGDTAAAGAAASSASGVVVVTAGPSGGLMMRVGGTTPGARSGSGGGSSGHGTDSRQQQVPPAP